MRAAWPSRYRKRRRLCALPEMDFVLLSPVLI